MTRKTRKPSQPKHVLFASYWWVEELMCRVAHHATSRGWHLDLQMCLTNQVPKSWSGDGIITMRSGDVSDIRDFLKRAECPVVSMNLNSHPLGIPCVAFDQPAASRLAANHFLDRGFREFAFYCRPRQGKILYGTRLALAAFQEQVEAAHHPCRTLDWLAAQGNGPDTWDNRLEWLRRTLRDAPKPLALFAPDPDCAVEIVDACQYAHLNIPDQVAVLCMHGMEFFNECSLVPLSSIDVDNDAKARMACDLLEALMNGAPPPKQPVLIPPSGLSARASTDTLAASDPSVMKAIRFMLDHYSESVSIEATASASGLSRTGIFRAFKTDLGQTPHALLMRIRLDRAKRMLRETDAKLREVAEACGFNHPVSLHVHFKKALNMSPGEYRKQSRQA